MNPILSVSGRPPLPGATVEYSAGPERVRRVFANAEKARRFYVAQYQAGNQPKVVATQEIPMSEATTPVVTTAAVAPKPATRKAAPKPKAPAKKAAAPSANGGLTGNEIKALTALAKARKPLTRNNLRAATGVQKGWSGLLGADSKTVADDTLRGRGYVSIEDPEHRPFAYQITARGRKALDAAK